MERMRSKTSAPTPSLKIIMVLLIFTIISVVLVTEYLESYLHTSEVIEGLSHIVVLAMVLTPMFYFGWYRPLNRQMKLRQQSEDEVRNLSHRLMEVREQERRMLARDLHDVFGQKVISLQVQIDALHATLQQKGVADAEICQKLSAVVDDMGEDLRNVLTALRPGSLEELGLTAATESLCQQVAQQGNLEVRFRSAGIKGRLDPEVEIALYRVCQEALTNAVKHAAAKRVEVSLFRSHPWIILSVKDDGLGLPGTPDAVETPPGPEAYGLLGMRERVASVGGTLKIRSKPGRGLHLRVEVPAESISTEGSQA